MKLRDARAAMAIALGLMPALQGLAQTAPPAVRLPQDTARDMQPAQRGPLLSVDRERFAEQVPAGADTTVFRLTGIDLVGNTAIPTPRLEALWAGLVGRDIPLSAVFEVAAAIGAAYRDAGFVLSQAVVPQQQIDQSGARVRIRVAEGYVSAIIVAGDVPGAARILRMLAPVRDERPLTLATLERHLLLLGDLPGIQAQASLRAAAEDNAAALELTVVRSATAASLSWSNRTARSVGPHRAEAAVEHRGTFGDFDRHALRWVGSGSRRLNLLAYSGSTPLGERGLAMSWSASATRSQPRAGELFQFATRSDGLSLGLAYPMLRSRTANLAWRAALAGYNGRSDIVDGLPVSNERLRSVRLGLAADLTDAFGGINLVDAEAVRGLSGLGASRSGDPALPRTGSQPQFTKLTLYAARLQSLGGEWSLLAAATAQASNDLLSSAEQLGLGGEVFLRAYDPSELLGDRGRAAKIELRYNTPPGLFLGLLSGLQATAYGYYEGGTVRTLASAEAAAASSASAAAGGIGLRFSVPHGVKGYLEIAKPIHRPTAHDGDKRARVFAGIGVDL